MRSNKRNLIRVGVKPADLESYTSSMPILRRALLSNESGGDWQLPPSDAIAREFLVAEGLLLRKNAAKEDVFQVFKEHSRRLGLPKLKTYNGYVLSLLSRLNPNIIPMT